VIIRTTDLISLNFFVDDKAAFYPPHSQERLPPKLLTQRVRISLDPPLHVCFPNIRAVFVKMEAYQTFAMPGAH
jgi:hypothetical protein